MDIGPASRLLSNTREEGETASHCPAHSPSGAHLSLKDQIQGLGRPTRPSVHLQPQLLCSLLSSHSQLPTSCYCTLVPMTF